MFEFAQYENARHLGEHFAEAVPGLQLLAVRDLESGEGELLRVKLDDKESELTLTFEELNAALGNEEAKKFLFARWMDEVTAPAQTLTSYLPQRRPGFQPQYSTKSKK